jgi:hypothetical protein
MIILTRRFPLRVRRIVPPTTLAPQSYRGATEGYLRRQADQEDGWDESTTEGAPLDAGVQVGVGIGAGSGVPQGGSGVCVVVGGVGVDGGLEVVGGVFSVGVGEVGVGEVGVGEVGVGEVGGVGVDGFLVGDGLSGSVHGGVVLVGGFTGSVCVGV